MGIVRPMNETESLWDLTASVAELPWRKFCFTCDPYHPRWRYVFQVHIKSKYGFVVSPTLDFLVEDCQYCGTSLTRLTRYRACRLADLISQNKARLDCGLSKIIEPHGRELSGDQPFFL